MAPAENQNDVLKALKDVTDKLYELQQQVHGFVPETQPIVEDQMVKIVESMNHLQTLTDATKSPQNPIHGVHIAPDVVNYVEDGRNPDIYNREFVELVQRGNAVINGKQRAFRDFSAVLARQLKTDFPGWASDIDRIMTNSRTDWDGDDGIQRPNGASATS